MNPLLTLLPALLALPLILLFGERYRNLREATSLIAASITFVLNLILACQFLDGIPVTSDVLRISDQLTVFLAAEPLGILFALLASFLWIITTIYSLGYLRDKKENHQTRFYSCFALAIAAVMAAAYAGNLLTLFIAYEVITLSTFPLVTHAGTPEAKHAGRIYLGLLMGTSIGLLLPALIAINWLAGGSSFQVGGILNAESVGTMWMSVLFVLVVFGTAKAALMPVHLWLPNAMVAPTPVSALLHAVAVVKTGVFLILKAVVYIFGLDWVNHANITQVLLSVAALTIVVASLIAMRQDNLKARLAYSTIGQLAYIVLAAFIANQLAVVGAGLHIVAHAFAKITLFFCAGAIMVSLHKKKVSELDGIGRLMPWTMTAFFIASLSIIGLPPLVGVWSKFFIAQAAVSADQLWLVAVLMLSSLLSMAYLLPIPLRAFFAKAKTTSEATSTENCTAYQEAPLPCLIAIGTTTLACVALFFYSGPMARFLMTITQTP